MKKTLLAVLAIALMVGVSSCNKGTNDKNRAMTPTEDSISTILGEGYAYQKISQSAMPGSQKTDNAAFLKGLKEGLKADTSMKDQSYVQGYMMGIQLAQQMEQMENQGIKLSKNKFLTAFSKVLKNKKLKPEEAGMLLQQLSAKVEPLYNKAQKDATVRIKEAGKAYIESLSGYTKTKSGLCYKVEKKGNGQTYKQDQWVEVKYKGMHINGKVFDESEKATPFQVNDKQVIKGFVEILKLMSPGEKVTVVIPSDLGYGEQGSVNPMTGEPKIAGGETLVFELETGKVTTAPAQEAPQTPQAMPQTQAVK